jgi:hypothetical protein
MSRPQLDRVYRDRNLLACAVALQQYNGDGDGGWYVDDDSAWPVVWFYVDGKQCGFHVPPEMTPLLEQSQLPQGPLVYDHHDRPERNNRLMEFIEV